MINLFDSSQSKNGTAETLRVMVPVIIVIIILVAGKSLLNGIIGAFRSPFESLDILDTKEEASAKTKAEKETKKQEEAGKNSPFSPAYYKELQKNSSGGVWLLKSADADRIARKIYIAKGLISDNPAQMLAAIKECTYKSQVSFLAEAFARNYGVDLLSWLTDTLDTTSQKIELGKIINYVNSLKDGRI